MTDPERVRILILEDDPADAELLERELRRAGEIADCRRAENEQEFLAGLSPLPDLVLADYRVPGFGALAALRLLAARALDVPVIVVTGTLGDEALVECLREGATDYLLKDRLGRLGKAVRNAVVQGRLRLAQRRHQQLVQAILDGGTAAIYVKDTAGRYLLVNRHYASLLGKGRDEIVGRRDDEVWPAEGAASGETGETAALAERLRAEDRRALAAGTAIEVEEEMLRAGEPRSYWTVRFPLVDLDGRAYAVCGISTDVTDRKRLEARLRQGQKMEAVGQLAGGLAHDFNNLLTVILGYANLLAKQLAAQPAPLAQVEQLRKAGEQGAALTRQLLAFSRQQALQPSAVDLDAVVADFETMLRRLIGEDVELATALRSRGSLVLADRGQLEQVVLNLAINARDAMPAGGRLVVETADADLDAAYAESHPGVRPGPHVLLAVSDTGQGIDAATRSRIFEPFFTTKPPGQGTGLGLATVHGIVHQSGGHVDVYSEPGQGTTFRIYLPRIAAPAEAVEAAPALAAPPSPPNPPSPVSPATPASPPSPLTGIAPGTGAPPAAAARDGAETVLVLEDEELVRKLVEITLRGGGYAVLTARSAADALALAAHHAGPIHLVLSDVVMPEMSGPELAARIAALRPRARILFTSGYSGRLLDGKVLPLGAEFIAKPFRPQELLRKVREVLGNPPADPARAAS
jgi:two-component system cell cycle sensor histidine kinase/response regulator CckA